MHFKITSTEITDFFQIGLLVVAFFLGQMKATLDNKSSQKQEAKNEAIRAYRMLMGMRIPIMQDFVSRYEAQIFFMYHERKFLLAYNTEGAPKDYEKYVDFQEAKRWQHKSEDLVNRISDDFKAMFESCATLSIYFKDNRTVQNLLDEISEIKTFELKDFNEIDAKNLDASRDKAVKDIQVLVKAHYSDPINKLLKEIRKDLF